MADPFAVLQEGIAAAMPGDTVHVLPGTYAAIQSVRHGEPGSRIVIRAEMPRDAVIEANGTALEVGHDHHTFEGLVFDSGYGPGDGIEGGSNDLELIDVEVRRTTGDCVDLRNTNGARIEASTIHHCIAVFDPDNNADAHGVTGDSLFDVTIVDTEMYLTSGDAIQVSPSRSPWDNLWVERTTMWSGPLDEAENGWAEGMVIGENAFDSKVDGTDLNGSGANPKATFVDVVAYGWRGSITNQGAFNVKEDVDFLLDRAMIHGSELAFRLRAPARVRIQNAVVWDVDRAFRLEDGIADLQVFNITVGGAIALEPIDEAGGAPQNPTLQNVLFLADALPALAQDPSNLAVDESVFVDAAGNDYRLVMGSAPTDAGVEVAGVDVDRDGVPRPFGTAFDVGAFEWTDMPPGGTETGDPDGGSGSEASDGTGAGSDEAGSGADSTGPSEGSTSGASTGGSGGSDSGDGSGGEASGGGCSCTSGGGVPGFLALGTLVLGWRRRRGSSAR